MEKSLFEQMGGTYTRQGDYLLLNLVLPAGEERPTGVWRRRRLRYLKQQRRIQDCNLLTSGKLHAHLADVEEQAQEFFSRLVNEYVEQEGITEQLKATNQIAWIKRMNNICSITTEIVSKEFICI